LNTPKKIKKTNQNEIDNLIRNIQSKPESNIKKDKLINNLSKPKSLNEISK
jgi:hypothetical protein